MCSKKGGYLKQFLLILIGLFLVNSGFAGSQSCQSEIGKVQAELINLRCEMNDGYCGIEYSCFQLIGEACSGLQDKEEFACGQNLFFKFYKGYSSHERCEDISSGDPQSYFACRQNLFNGYPID